MADLAGTVGYMAGSLLAPECFILGMIAAAFSAPAKSRIWGGLAIAYALRIMLDFAIFESIKWQIAFPLAAITAWAFVLRSGMRAIERMRQPRGEPDGLDQ